MSVLVGSLSVIGAVALVLGAVTLFCECMSAWLELDR